MLLLPTSTVALPEPLDMEPPSPVKIIHFEKVKVCEGTADCLLTPASVATTTGTPRPLEDVDDFDASSETTSSDSESSSTQMLMSQTQQDSSLAMPLSEINTNDVVDALEELGFPLWQALEVVKRCETVEQCIEMIQENGWDQE
eukprot:gnl/MRDRNA2_/MRDRNA2_50210_c0_seq1.p1 gnl/MRDRNA2_/MRDRNA2_50210_c0~~gnl/MRDRNA2_/MRDRNA2_50210_c0_seq1.p1  ORF type:complete len:144 (-),score=25.93 gnl/MRDRNA2_/MRDRNA2_50210_c0_seq1:303-734(-)